VTVEALMPFLASPVSTLYARIYERLGLDPAADFADDDVVQFNLRTALALKSEPDSELQDVIEGKVVTDLERRMRLG
jgi:hypothetical protein